MTNPVLFDEVETKLRDLVATHRSQLGSWRRIVAVRDLFGRIRFLLERRPAGDQEQAAVRGFLEDARRALGRRAYPPDHAVLFLDDLAAELEDELKWARRLDDGQPPLDLLDRQVTGQEWARAAESAALSHRGPARLAFFSLKGGVGRSTAAAMTARHLASQGKHVLVVDLDLEAPGLSASLLPHEKLPDRGVVDWFVEDAVGQGEEIAPKMLGRSPLADDLAGSIQVAPGFGREPGDYLAKLGRVFLDLPREGTLRPEHWTERLVRLVRTLEGLARADVVLLDARAGLSDLASVAVTDLGAEILLFALDNEPTWAGYSLLFDHWLRFGAIHSLRERLHLVAALVPETDRSQYLQNLRERAWNLFLQYAYDEAEPATAEDITETPFNFDLDDAAAPHTPIPIYWNRGFASIGSLYSVEPTLVEAAFGSFLEAIDSRALRTRVD